MTLLLEADLVSASTIQSSLFIVYQCDGNIQFSVCFCALVSPWDFVTVHKNDFKTEWNFYFKLLQMSKHYKQTLVCYNPIV